jgi:MFS family permease
VRGGVPAVRGAVPPDGGLNWRTIVPGPAMAERDRQSNESPEADDQHRSALWTLSAATFVIFFQAFMVAPLIPLFSRIFEAPEQHVGLVVPAFMIPYGFAVLGYGLISDRIGRRPLIVASMGALVVLSAGTALAQDASQLILWRLATGIGAAAVVPMALTLIGDLYPFERRGKPIGS